MIEIARINEQHLLNVIAKFPPEILYDDSKRAFWLSVAVVKHFLGSEWLERHVSVENPQPGFFRVIAGEGPETQLSVFRIVDLGELLFNLQNTDGFDLCIDRIRRGVLEGTFAELDFGRMLYVSGAAFRFVEPRKKRGDDYDIEITLADGTVVCADAKCKIESTDFSDRTILNTLNHARKQFPGDRPSVIFIKVPSRWFERIETAIELNGIAQNFLRGTQRIVSIKIYVASLVYRDKRLIHSHGFKEISNPNNRFEANRNWDMFAEPHPTTNWNGMPLRWKRILFFPKDGPDE